MRDIDCAFKLFKKSALQQIDIESRGTMINTEIMVKLARLGCTIVEVGVSNFPRRSGAPQGAKLRVIARALREVKAMYPRPVVMPGPWRTPGARYATVRAARRPRWGSGAGTEAPSST